MTKDKFKELRGMSDSELYEWTAGWKTNTDKWIAGQQEIKRRSEAPSAIRSWIAIVIAGGALLVSLFSLVVSCQN